VRAPLRRLRRAPADDPERRRKLADRLAAVAGAASPYADARAALAELDELRTVLREHHHAATAIETLAALAERSPEHAWEAGLLAGAERTRMAEAGNAVAYAFTRATRRKLWAWVP
jgi:prophage DNA circulation protein